MNIQLSGLVINPLYPFVGASPKGNHKCACHGDVFFFEKQMPICAQIKTNDEIIAADKDGKFIIQPHRTVNKSHPYYSQGQFRCTCVELHHGIWLCIHQEIFTYALLPLTFIIL